MDEDGREWTRMAKSGRGWQGVEEDDREWKRMAGREWKRMTGAVHVGMCDREWQEEVKENDRGCARGNVRQGVEEDGKERKRTAGGMGDHTPGFPSTA